MKLLLNESIEERMERAENFLKENSIEDSPTQEMANSGIADMINNLIKSEYDAITDYNNAITTIKTENSNLDLIQVFQDILEEENIHVGQLQKALQQVSPAAENIDKGVQEAEEQLYK